MNILDKYITREFSKLFAIMSITFIALYLIVDFFEKSRMFFSNHATAVQMVSYFVFSIPVIISLIMPAAVLLATLMTFGNLTKFNEVTAMKANGISLYRMALPVVIMSLAICLFLFFFSEIIRPGAEQKAEQIIKVDIQKQTMQGYFKQNEIWYRSANAIYNFKMFDTTKNTLRGITINYLNPDFTLKSRIDAGSATWQNGQWTFYDLLITTFDSNNIPVLQRMKKKVINLPEKADDFKIIQKDAEKMGYFELGRYVRKIKSEGYDATRYIVDLQGKIAYPLVTVILVLIGVLFALRSERSGGVMQSLGIGIFIGFSYFIVHAFGMSLGRSGVMPPLLAAWVANILFLAAAAILFSRVRT